MVFAIGVSILVTMSERKSGGNEPMANDNENDNDPGIVILFKTDTEIHNCLNMMPLMPAHLPRLMPGMKIKMF